MSRQSLAKPISGFERMLLAFGVALLLVYAAARLYTAAYSRLELRRYYTHSGKSGEANSGQPDFRLWSKQRVAAYDASLNSRLPLPLAILKIPSINLEVPLLEGTDDLTLNRAVGHIQDTAAPGSLGNIGVAGHRDGFFRGLKDMQTGDVIELFHQNRTDRYIVDEILIVGPEETSVLSQRPKPSLTLVTCYPFYFVGSAPLRYIVHASVTVPQQPEKGKNE
jgi:sortase A